MSVQTKSRLSGFANRIAESETLKMAQMARNLKAQGHDVISLSLGEPDFDTPDHIKMAAIKALTEGFTKYTPVAGIAELTDAISKKFKRDNNLEYASNQIVVSSGAKQSIFNVSMALLEEGDECIIFAPYWVSYAEIIKMSGATPVYVSAGVEQDYKITAEQVEAAITERTKVVLFSSPCNPTGAVFTKSELRAIADVIAKYDDIYIVSDEIYEYINYTDAGHVSIGIFDNVKERTITVNGFAKGFAMTGWRLGYIGAPKWIADACNKIQGQVTSGANSFSQKAAVVALTADLEPTWKMRDEFRRRRDMVIELLSEIKGFKVPTPEGAFYIFPDISTYFGTTDGTTLIRNADDFCDYIMLNVFVGLVSGSAFGEPNCFRLSYAASETQLREAVRRIKEACERLR
jgi:aspartate aminotransferase